MLTRVDQGKVTQIILRSNDVLNCLIYYLCYNQRFCCLSELQEQVTQL